MYSQQQSITRLLLATTLQKETLRIRLGDFTASVPLNHKQNIQNSVLH